MLPGIHLGIHPGKQRHRSHGTVGLLGVGPAKIIHTKEPSYRFLCTILIPGKASGFAVGALMPHTVQAAPRVGAVGNDGPHFFYEGAVGVGEHPHESEDFYTINEGYFYGGHPIYFCFIE